MSFGKDQLFADAADFATSDKVFSLLRSATASLTSTTVAAKEALDVFVANSTPIDVNIASATGTLNVAEVYDTASNFQSLTVGTTEVALPSLAARKLVAIQNLGSKPVYLGKTGVSTASGYKLSPGAQIEVKAGPAQAWFLISTAAAQDVRVFEVA